MGFPVDPLGAVYVAPVPEGVDLAGVLVLVDAVDDSSALPPRCPMGFRISASPGALAHPGRVDSLVLISTSPAVPGGPSRPELPPMSEELRAYSAAQVPRPDWTEPTGERHVLAA